MRVRQQEDCLDVTVQVLAYRARAIRVEPILDHQQRPLQMHLERYEENDNFLFLDAALVQPKQAVWTRYPRNGRHLIPVDVDLEDGRLVPQALAA